MKIAKAREAAEILGREGLSQRVIFLVNEFDGSYKGAINLAGRLSVIAKACTFDDYWHQKARMGEVSESDKLLDVIENEANS